MDQQGGMTVEIEGPWTPGLASTIPGRLMPKVTLYDPKCGLVSWGKACDLHEVTGLRRHMLATFRPERLALHEVLIRATGELYVPDGPDYGDLGSNLRAMVGAVFDGYVKPFLDGMAADHAALRDTAAGFVAEELRREELLRRAAGGSVRNERALGYAQRWHEAGGSDLPTHCRRSLARVLSAVLSCRGALIIDDDVIIEVATNLVSNSAGADLVGEAVAPLFDEGASALGYRRLPPQSEPVVLNAKGASASGKSSIRDQQKRIALGLGLDWRDFAIVSPDYWRKHLLDYGGLGGDYKYASMLTGQELEIIDQKLDRLLMKKAQSDGIPHLLVDRFRFDSFRSPRYKDGGLLSRFGSRVYLFYLITPPEETVVRAWGRGLETGRYKAVDDLLHHNIEAYSGMPDLFLYWATLRSNKEVYYEFLDNSVPRHQAPRTIAFGKGGRLIVRDLAAMCNIERFRHVNMKAGNASEVLSRRLTDREAMVFLNRCCAKLDRVDFVDGGGRNIVATARRGKLLLDSNLAPPEVQWGALGDVHPASGPLGAIDPEDHAHTIGS